MSELKYKEGDSVLIKDINWYNKYKDEDGVVLCGEFVFLEGMKEFCSETLTISEDVGDGYLMLEDYHGYVWTDEMIERLVERNGKTYPYKIGDRVVLKGNNRCATITDLKYNSWGNLSYYIKIDNDKDISIDYPTDLLLPYDNMVEGLVEEETKPKNEDEKNGESKPKYEDEVNGDYYSTPKYLVRPSGYQFVDENGNIINATKIVLEKINTLKTQSDNMETETHKGYYTTEPETTNKSKKVAWFTFWDNDFADKVELDLSNRELIQEDGKWFVVKKKNVYPKTYEECCDKINFKAGFKEMLLSDDEYSLYIPFIKLKRCRDAYWKIAGDEMGLGKPWEPDWTSYESKHIIYYEGDCICFDDIMHANTILAFPTKEMRDAFYENFKEEIEICKELL